MTHTSSSSYHHGDLYRSLLNCASEIISEAGTSGLSMRKLADRVGVSRTAPYHHFKDKNALLCAIAEEGFRQQERLLSEFRQQSGSKPTEQLFREHIMAFLQFASSNPDQYDLMFGREIWRDGKPTEELKSLAYGSFQNWLNWIEELQQQQLLSTRDTPLRTAQVCWATLHGICRLLNDGVYTQQNTLEEMGQSAVNMLLSH